jgi:crotonobetainyl-CoA:carnitine CoA-transferase CaiB-like acyl-CoA transferase
MLAGGLSVSGSPVLEGVRVLSLAEQYPGPYATLMLADLGADVVQVERAAGDPARQFVSFYEALNRNKRSVVLDLKSTAGRADFLRLAEVADVVLEGFRPGTVDRLGVGYAVVAERNPDVVYVAISGYGQTGPQRLRPNHDVGYQATAGMLFDRARSGSAGAAPSVQVGDLAAGMSAFAAVLLGLFHRERRGHGLYIDVSMLDVLVSMMATTLATAAASTGSSTLFLDEPGYRLYETADSKLIALGVAHEDAFWQSLCHVTGLDAYAKHDHAERIEHADEIVAALASALRARPRDEWIEVLAEADVPCGPVYDLDEVADDPQVQARRLILEKNRSVRQPLLPHGSEHSTGTRPAPRLGAHTDEVFREWTELSQRRRNA